MNILNNLRSRRSPQTLEMTLMSGERNEEGGGENPSQVQVEPKTYFANERTFIQWISAALLLLTVSSVMMGSGNYNGTSSVIAFSSLVLVCYASFVYFRRVRLLRSGNAYGYLDFVGPTILAVGVGIGVAIVFADAVKGSEFLPFGSEGEDDDRRFLVSQSVSPVKFQQAPEMRPVEDIFKLQEVHGKCSRYAIGGINLLEYQPRDIILNEYNTKQDSTTGRELIVATPQALVSHPLPERRQDQATCSTILSELPDMEIESMIMVGDRLFALSIGPLKTELIEFSAAKEIQSTHVIQDSTSASGSLVFVPSSDESRGKLYIYLDGTIHTYHLLPHNNESPLSLSRTGTINMKVMNHGGLDDINDPITAMEHFEGLTYVLRGNRNIIEAWDLQSASLLAEMPLPSVSGNDTWVGMAFQRQDEEEEGERSSLRKRKMGATSSEMKTSKPVFLHMPLDSFPPQLWTFRLERHDEGNDGDRNVFSLPECDGV